MFKQKEWNKQKNGSRNPPERAVAATIEITDKNKNKNKNKNKSKKQKQKIKIKQK